MHCAPAARQTKGSIALDSLAGAGAANRRVAMGRARLAVRRQTRRRKRKHRDARLCSQRPAPRTGFGGDGGVARAASAQRAGLNQFACRPTRELRTFDLEGLVRSLAGGRQVGRAPLVLAARRRGWPAPRTAPTRRIKWARPKFAPQQQRPPCAVALAAKTRIQQAPRLCVVARRAARAERASAQARPGGGGWRATWQRARTRTQSHKRALLQMQTDGRRGCGTGAGAQRTGAAAATEAAAAAVRKHSFAL